MVFDFGTYGRSGHLSSKIAEYVCCVSRILTKPVANAGPKHGFLRKWTIDLARLHSARERSIYRVHTRLQGIRNTRGDIFSEEMFHSRLTDEVLSSGIYQVSFP